MGGGRKQRHSGPSGEPEKRLTRWRIPSSPADSPKVTKGKGNTHTHTKTEKKKVTIFNTIDRALGYFK